MAIVTGDRYLENLLKFVENQSPSLLDSTLTLKLNPVGLHYVQSRLEALHELEGLLAGAPVDYLRAYISDLGDHRALEQLRRILGLIPCLKVVSVLGKMDRDPTPLCLLPFGKLKFLELRGCDLSNKAARGLLELRGTLEKMIVHNSTDALRHVFASRIVDIKDSPVWNKLAMLSCPCNGLVLMDESLQLLPSVETLDLSRNRFAKVDNLRRCTKLKHLDLGFNHLRSISSLGEVGYSIVKLVLRNNALTSLRGIETFTSLEGLDLSYNIISNISELEILSSLPSLQSLWLEGNPICCAPWYRAQVFSLFVQPENLELDDKRITTRESWKRQIVLASRIKRPAGFGFYSPAKDNDEVDGNINKTRKKPSRLASIEEQRSGSFLEAVQQDSASCGSDIQGREEVPVSEGEAEIFDLMNRVEFLKKEHSVLWLREFKEWMDQSSENLADGNERLGLMDPGRENYRGNREGDMQLGETSVHVSDMLHTTEDDARSVFNSDNSYGDSSMYHNHISDSEIAFLESSVADSHEESVPDLQNGDISLGRVQEKDPSEPQFNDLLKSRDSLVVDTLTSHIGIQTSEEASVMHATSIDEMMEPTLSFSYTGSPPHFQEDILQRRQNLEEEFMQLSVKSFSLASSDSDTSTSDDEFCKYYTSSPETPEASHVEELSHPDQLCTDNKLVNGNSCSTENGGKQESGFWERMTRKTRLRKRVVSLSEEQNGAVNGKLLALEQSGTSEVDVEDVTPDRNIDGSDFPDFFTDECSSSTLTAATKSQHVTEEVIKNYFHSNITKSNVSETCVRSILCDCVLPKELEYKESEVAIVLSDADKIYLFLVATTSDGSETVLETIGCHVLDEIDEVVIAIGLQVLRVHIETGATYLFKTRSVEKSRELLSLLSICDSTSNRCSLISAEKVQVELFEKYICRDLKVGIFMYSMLLFWCTQNEEKLWLSRSLFVIEGYLILCIEDLVHFSDDDTFSSSYFSLDSCCSLNHITEMVIEPMGSRCATLTLDYDKFDPRHHIANEKMANHLNTKMAAGSHKWKLKWFSEEILLKFVALLKALHANTAMHPLTVRYEPHL